MTKYRIAWQVKDGQSHDAGEYVFEDERTAQLQVDKLNLTWKGLHHWVEAEPKKSWKDKLEVKLDISKIDFSELEKRAMIDMAKHKDEAIAMIANAYQVPQSMLVVGGITAYEFEREYTERLRKGDLHVQWLTPEVNIQHIPFPPNYFQDEWKCFIEEIQPILDAYFQERCFILPSWAMPVILASLLILLTLIIGA